MKNKSAILISATLFLALIISGCYEIKPIKTVVEDNNVVFYLNGLQKDYPSHQVTLRELEVRKKKGCQTESDCLMWLIEGDDHSGPLTKLVYGEVPNGMNEKKARKELGSGEYSVSGTAWLIDKDGTGVSYAFSSDFNR